MLRDVSETLYASLMEAFPPNTSYSQDAFSRPPMPPAVTHFLVQTLRHRADLETRRLRSEWFDTSHPDVQQARADFAAALFAQGRIPAGRWAPLLKQVVDQVLAYLVRPVPTLVEFAFQGKEDMLSSASLRHRVAYFSAYPYLADALRNYTDEHTEGTIDREEATEMLATAEQERIASMSPEGWVELLEPLFDLFDTVETEFSAPPVELVGSFFKCKEQHEIAERLFNYEADTISRAALRRLLQRVDAPRKPEEKPPIPRQGAEPSQRLAEESGPIPLWMQFQHTTAAPQQPEATPDISRDEAPASGHNESEGESRPLWMRFRPDPSSSASTPSPLSTIEEDLMGPRGPANRDFFIEQLFNGSEDMYMRTLRRLQDTGTWAEASRIIAQDVFRRHKVNIYSEPAVLFTDLVEARFKQKA